MQLVIGWRGLARIAREHGDLEDIEAHPIYKDQIDELRASGHPLVNPATGELNIDPNDKIMVDAANRSDDKIVGAVALARIAGRSRPLTHVLTRDEIEKRRAVGQGNTPAWRNWLAEQCRKTVIRALLNSGRIQLAPTLADVLRSDEVAEADHDPVEHVQVAQVEPIDEKPDPGPDQEVATVCHEIRRQFHERDLTPAECQEIAKNAIGHEIRSLEAESLPDLHRLLTFVERTPAKGADDDDPPPAKPIRPEPVFPAAAEAAQDAPGEVNPDDVPF